MEICKSFFPLIWNVIPEFPSPQGGSGLPAEGPEGLCPVPVYCRQPSRRWREATDEGDFLCINYFHLFLFVAVQKEKGGAKKKKRDRMDDCDGGGTPPYPLRA